MILSGFSGCLLVATAGRGSEICCVWTLHASGVPFRRGFWLREGKREQEGDVIIFLAFLFVFGLRGRFLGAGGASWGTQGSSCAVLELAASSEETGRNGRRARVTRYGSLEAVLGASYCSFGGLLRSSTRSLGRLLGHSFALPGPSWSWRRLGGKPVRNRRLANEEFDE